MERSFVYDKSLVTAAILRRGVNVLSLPVTVLRPDFRTSITAEKMCLCDMQQYPQQDAQTDALIAYFLSIKRQTVTCTVHTALTLSQPHNIISPTKLNNFVIKVNDSDLSMHQKAYKANCILPAVYNQPDNVLLNLNHAAF